jgi:hypothetical protein
LEKETAFAVGGKDAVGIAEVLSVGAGDEGFDVGVVEGFAVGLTKSVSVDADEALLTLGAGEGFVAVRAPGEGSAVGLTEGFAVGLAEGLAVGAGEGLVIVLAEGLADGGARAGDLTVGQGVLSFSMVGAGEGFDDGSGQGFSVGGEEGFAVGTVEGFVVEAR